MASEEYDFIIVGGGTAGLVLANRLSEDPTQSILVLEAGSNHSKNIRVKAPGLFRTLVGSELEWGLKTEPQERLNGRRINLAQGKMLGGTSAMSAGLFAPPTKAMIDTWATLGNEGWDWETLEPYYAKVYTSPIIPKSLEKKLGVDGWETNRDEMAKGPVETTFSGDPLHPIREAWVETFKDRGYFMRDNPWTSGEAVGAFSLLSSSDPVTGEKNHAATAYYNPVKHRENLHTLTDATVDKVLFGDGHLVDTAVGVRYHSKTGMKTVSARKEVILAAGTLQSPKLLELSGIGNPDLLKRLDIEVVKEMTGVGENLQDHMLCYLCFEAVDGLETLDPIYRGESDAINQAMEDFEDGAGLLTSSGVLSSAYMPVIEHVAGHSWDVLRSVLEEHRPSTGAQPSPAETRDAAIYEIAEKALFDPNQPSASYLALVGQMPGLPNPITKRHPPPEPGSYITLSTIFTNPLSRGHVHIKARSVFEPPVIDPRYFTSPIDVEVFTQHMVYLHNLPKLPPLSSLFKQPLKPYKNQPRFNNFYTAMRYIQTSAISMWHLVGTCSMLPEDKAGVVDTRLRVYGVRNLRVVDASVIPVLPPGHPQSTVYALAERAADIIKEDHGLMTAS
ncbi:putative GMC oxidoreductase [Camillea tinctor]|nr:putative GMC oxidoreductase [Camillea tinctor]